MQVEAERKEKKGKTKKKEHKRKHKRSMSRDEKGSDLETSIESKEDTRKRHRLTSDRHQGKGKHSKYPPNSKEEDERRKGDNLTSEHKGRYSKHSSRHADSRCSGESEDDRRKSIRSICDRHHQHSNAINSSKLPENEKEKRRHVPSTSDRHYLNSEPNSENKIRETHSQGPERPGYNRRRGAPKMTEEEREARLREMKLDAELHEEQRWKRVKKATEADAQEALRASSSRGKNFLDATQKSMYGTEKGGSCTIEESVRRRAYYSQGGTTANESNAFRR